MTCCEPALVALQANRGWGVGTQGSYDMAGSQTREVQSGEHHVRAAGRLSHLQPHPKRTAPSALTVLVTEGSEFLPSLLCQVGKEAAPARDRTGAFPPRLLRDGVCLPVTRFCLFCSKWKMSSHHPAAPTAVLTPARDQSPGRRSALPSRPPCVAANQKCPFPGDCVPLQPRSGPGVEGITAQTQWLGGPGRPKASGPLFQDLFLTTLVLDARHSI